MPRYTQDNRPIRIDTDLPTDDLLLDGFHGVEGVSMPFAFHVDLLSEKPDIDTRALLRSPMLITVAPADPEAEPRRIHGLVRRFVQLGQQDDLTVYHAELVPWLWFLSLSQECRIYQNLTPLEIIEQVFKDRGYSDFEIRVEKPPPKREFTVQYRESHLNFVSRLLEEEGIFYFFEHDGEKHQLVIADQNSAASNPIPTKRFHRQRIQDEEDVVLELEREHTLYPGTVTLRDYDYLQPTLTLENTLAGEYPEEVYDYPGLYTKLEEGDRYVRLQLESQEATHQTLRGESNCRDFASGHVFELAEHYRTDVNDSYLLLRVQHFMKGDDFRSSDSGQVEYHNDFLAMPVATPYRPQRRTPKPMIHGTQTALVVGPAGEEVHTDKHARVKIQFYWDRVGQKDEKSSCWVRVATPWGGKGWGNVTIPRIDNEVVVAFLEGDPDRPLIIGSVYNADQTPPFTLPGAGIQMGGKSRSSPGGGGYNEMTMTDTKGKEKMTIHAQYDMSTTVQHDDTQAIKNNRTITVDGTHTETIQKDVTITENAKHTQTIKNDMTLSVTAGKQSTTVKNDIDITSQSGHVHIKASTEILLEVGSSKLLMKADGSIELSGVAIAVKGSAEVRIKGGNVMSEADANHTIKGALVMSEGSGTNTVKGGMVMLNP
jgi:type VI secretion system secreted protein VgrG